MNLSTFGALLYSVFYVLLEPVAGGLLVPFLISGAAYANYLSSTYGTTANYWAGGVQVVSWLVQFVGHGIFEGRAPALLDSLVQSLLLAPLFVWMEVLFFLGYRPELRARLHKNIEEVVSKVNAEKEKSQCAK